MSTPGVGWSNEALTHVVRVTENWIVSVTPMIFNDRIVLTRRSDWPHSYAAGWCYDKGPAAILAAGVWDPETQGSPVGFKKVACDDRVKAELPGGGHD